MGRVVLRVDLPDEGRAGPLRAHEGILAAHEVQVAGPEQPVVVGLGQPGQGDAAQRRRGRLVGQRCLQCLVCGARGHQQQRRCGRQRLKQRRDRGAGIAEQARHPLAGPRCHAVLPQPGACVEMQPFVDQARLADQPARAGLEARIEEPLVQPQSRSAELRRAQAVAAAHVGFGAEVLQVDPQWRPFAPRHAGHERGRRVAAEGLDHHVARLGHGRVGGPGHALPHPARRSVPSRPGRRGRRSTVARAGHAHPGRPPAASTRRCRRGCR